MTESPMEHSWAFGFALFAAAIGCELAIRYTMAMPASASAGIPLSALAIEGLAPGAFPLLLLAAGKVPPHLPATSEAPPDGKHIAAQEHHLRTIIKTVPECIVLLDREGAVLELNPAGLTVIEADDAAQVRGKELSSRVAPEDRAAWRKMIEAVFRGESVLLELQFTGFRGTRRWLEARSVPLRNAEGSVAALLTVARDATERKALEAQLRHAQKMEAIGNLTSGIAHDYNNILTAIIGYANIIKMKLPADDPLRAHALQILASTERAASLTQGLLTFGKKQLFSLAATDLGELMQRTAPVIRAVAGDGIQVGITPPSERLPVMVDPAQFENVIRSLAANARDSMDRGGAITVAAAGIELEDTFISIHGYGKKGHYAVLSFTDSGTGMDDATRKRIFEPFFTTKEPGKGTGLGLAIAYSIIKTHKGFINVYSEPGIGSTFKIYLPLIPDPTRSSSGPASRMPEGSGETILIAEDDSEVRSLTATILGQFGYTVIQARDGAEAVALFGTHRDAVQLVMLDTIMPNKNGRDAFTEIRRLRPDVKALFLSGYPQEFAADLGLAGTNVPFLTKPVSPRDLLKKIREVLES